MDMEVWMKTQTHLQISVFQVSQPEGFQALVVSEHSLDTKHKRLQGALHHGDLIRQGYVLHSLTQMIKGNPKMKKQNKTHKASTLQSLHYELR